MANHPEAARIAGTIRQQIGRGTLMATGARDFLYYGPAGSFSGKGRGGLTFKVGGGAHIGRFNVTLNGRDTYDVEYITGGNRPPKYKMTIYEVDNVYNDSLPELIRDLQEGRHEGWGVRTHTKSMGETRTRRSPFSLLRHNRRTRYAGH